MNGFNKLLEHFGTGLEKKLDNVLEEGEKPGTKLTTITREVIDPAIDHIKRLSQKNRISPQEALEQFGDRVIKIYLSKSAFTDHSLVAPRVKKTIAKRLSQNESGEVGAGGRQATMKDGPDDYLDGQKLVGGS